MPLIEKPGFYFDVPEDEYHADPVKTPSLSSTVARVMYDETPKHAHHAHPRLRPPAPGEVKKSDRPMDIGTAVHKRILGKGKQIDLLPFDDYKKQAARDMREASYEAGNTPILQSDMTAVESLAVGAAASLKELGRADIFDNCHTEVMMVWQEQNGVWCRALLDALPKDYETIPHLRLPELKSTDGSADVDTFSGRVFGQGYDVQMAFYRRGLRALLPKMHSAEFEWVVMEQNAPWAVNILTSSNQIDEEADHIARIAIDQWGICMSTGKWPGYAGGEMVETTTWRSMKREARNRWLLERMKDWQAPLVEKGSA